MKNIDIQKTSINTFFQTENLNGIFSINMNIFCFDSIDKAITFNSLFAKNYEIFLNSIHANNLLFFNKLLINNLRIIYKSQLLNTNNISNGREESNAIDNNNYLALHQENGFTSIDNSNIKYAFMHFTNDGVLLSEESGNKIENILFSFSFNSIRDCFVEKVPKQLVLPKEMLMTQSNTNKCCVKVRVDMKDVYDNLVFICSFGHSGYQSSLEVKYIQEHLIQKCSIKLDLNVRYAFDNNINMNSYISSNITYFIKFCL